METSRVEPQRLSPEGILIHFEARDPEHGALKPRPATLNCEPYLDHREDPKNRYLKGVPTKYPLVVSSQGA